MHSQCVKNSLYMDFHDDSDIMLWLALKGLNHKKLSFSILKGVIGDHCGRVLLLQSFKNKNNPVFSMQFLKILVIVPVSELGTGK